MRLLLLLALFVVSVASTLDVLGWGNNRGSALSLLPRLVAARNSATWKAFRTKFSQKNFRNVSDEEFHARIFESRSAAIKEHNKRFMAGKEKFEMGTEDEFRAIIPAIPTDLLESDAARNLPMANVSIGTDARRKRQIFSSLDLRNYGEINAIRNQGSCGSCFSFSSMCTIESAYYRKYRQSIDLSEQQGLECWPATAGQGCSGGWPVSVLQGISSYGITVEQLQPYLMRNGNCRGSTAYAFVKTVYQMPTDINSLKSCIYTYGALSILVDASAWGNYKSGLFYTTSVGAANHAVNLIGYGTDASGYEYWIIRNSWGTSWGEGGYMRMYMHSSTNSFLPQYTVGIVM